MRCGGLISQATGGAGGGGLSEAVDGERVIEGMMINEPRLPSCPVLPSSTPYSA